jgi:hypothetical protein
MSSFRMAPAKIAFEPGDIWESERLVVTVGTLTVGDNPDERCVVVYRRRADSSLAILLDAPSAVREKPMTFAPSSSNSAAVAQPMPRLAPVTIATLSRSPRSMSEG